MKKLALIGLLLLTGCSKTVFLPVLPDAPEKVYSSCPKLQLIENGTTELSVVTSVVTANYAEYHKCAAKVDAWMEWYSEQKKIIEQAK